MLEVVQEITSLFECVKKENNDMISYMKDLRDEKYDIIYDLKVDISTLEKKVDSLKVQFDNINHYEHGDDLVILRDIIPLCTPTEYCIDIVS